MHSLTLALALLAATPALDNDFVLVTRDRTVCAAPAPNCGVRVIVALEDVALESGSSRQRLGRGDVAVFGATDSYAIAQDSGFFEVVIKSGHPRAIAPAERIEPEKNALRHDGGDFFIFEEKLEPGDTRARHSHSQRVVIQLNRTRLQQWPDGAPEIFVETVPERPTFSPPVIHKVRNVGDAPLRGIVIEFKP
ncbi:MAG TPA: hypothetical protein VF460_05575 [Burkholderiales bacterium]